MEIDISNRNFPYNPHQGVSMMDINSSLERLPLFPGFSSDKAKAEQHRMRSQMPKEESDSESGGSSHELDDNEARTSQQSENVVVKRKRGRPRKNSVLENSNPPHSQNGKQPSKTPAKRVRSSYQNANWSGHFSDNSATSPHSSVESESRYDFKDDPNANHTSASSVRSIPCFYAECTYCYKRPGSTFAELSDRKLMLPSKFDNYLVRSCKKHHDKWKAADMYNKDSCEVCRGLNSSGSDDLQDFTNAKGVAFSLCNYCSHRQATTLGIKPIGTYEVSSIRMKRESESDEDLFKNKHSSSESESDFHESDVEEDSKNDDDIDEVDDAPPRFARSASKALPPNIEGRLTASRDKEDDEYVPEPKRKYEKHASRRESFSGSPSKKTPSINNNNRRRKSASLIMYTIYKRNLVDGWENVRGITYTPNCLWDPAVLHYKPSVESAENNLNTNIAFVDAHSPFKLSVRRLPNENSANELDNLGVFADTEIQDGQTIGEYAGRVTELRQKEDGSSSVSFRISNELQIEASEIGNEIALINKETDAKEANVRYDFVNGHVLAVAMRQISPGEELIGDYAAGEYRDKETAYLEIFTRIDEFNKKNLSEDERKNSAFQWFLDEGAELLRGKGKITVPINHRVPSKKGLASNLAPKRYSHVTKDQSEWGYVAQYEMLDLERAREDCWVTFKGGRLLSWDDLERAVVAWKSDPEKYAATFKMSEAQERREREEIAHSRELAAQQFHQSEILKESPPLPKTRKPRHEAKQDKYDKYDKYEQYDEPAPPPRPSNRREVSKSVVRDLSHSITPSTARFTGQEIEYRELSIKFDAQKDLIGTGRAGHVFKGYWRGYPVAVRFPLKATDEARERFMAGCNSLIASHPNLIQVYGFCRKEQLCMVMEYMNLGNLKKYITSLSTITNNLQFQFHGMYIPRIALDIARGMEFLHSKGILHRNLKSNNVLMKGELLDNGLIANMEVKLSDYGMDNETSLQLSSRDMEYLYFFAPEVLENRRHTAQSDVFSFGMVLCHMFSEGQDKPKQPAIVIQTSHYLQRWDPKWKELILRCTDRDPQRRPSFTTILDTLCELLAIATRDFMS